MIGVYDYTVLLTYASLLSAGTGIVVSLSNGGHPYIGIFFLLLCGLCDAFDGKVARTKADRTENEKKFGIQIDSLSDLVAFGVLPACIGIALLEQSSFFNEMIGENGSEWYFVAIKFLLFALIILYILAAMIRLAYFNVTEEERQQTEGGVRKYYVGLPVTSAALVFPTVALIQYITKADATILYFIVAAVTGFAFVSEAKIPKPGLKGIIIMIVIGLIEFTIMIGCLIARA